MLFIVKNNNDLIVLSGAGTFGDQEIAAHSGYTQHLYNVQFQQDIEY